jgi:Matrixin
MSRQRSALWAVAVAALALALPAPARASEGTPFLDDHLGTYMRLAHEYWGGPVPSCVLDGVTVVPVHAQLFDDPDPEVAARAEQPGCRLWIDRRTWRTLTRVEACTVVIHEWGHLLGFGHSHDPRDLMAEYPRRAPRPCAALAPRARRAGARAARAARSCAVRARRSGARTACVRHAG